MYLSNAQNWVKLCEQQAKIIEDLSHSFPERQNQHRRLSHDWRELAQKVRNGQNPKIVS
ncbi:hypothetical protein K0I73_14375 [Shewanella mesophila]|uniref:hypothetical protein n=1 Tax=Shewanella mesophila TaxID=2864208 RepID=UPI001C65D5E7|nr:hypothetical protein [Shewanella mesophila]QYJ85376.1 hypothetical protein K0I73_14375 [Shewanella mesophila]